MKPIIIAAALAVGLSGCAAFDNVLERDPVREAIASCNAISGTLNVLTPNKHRLSATQVSTVDKIVDMSTPICAADEPPATSADLLEDLATQIIAVQASLAEDS